MRHRKKQRIEAAAEVEKKAKRKARGKSAKKKAKKSSRKKAAKKNVLIPNNTTLRKLPATAIKRLAGRLDIEYSNKPETIAAIIEVRDNG